MTHPVAVKTSNAVAISNPTVIGIVLRDIKKNPYRSTRQIAYDLNLKVGQINNIIVSSGMKFARSGKIALPRTGRRPKWFKMLEHPNVVPMEQVDILPTLVIPLNTDPMIALTTKRLYEKFVSVVHSTAFSHENRIKMVNSFLVLLNADLMMKKTLQSRMLQLTNIINQPLTLPPSV